MTRALAIAAALCVLGVADAASAQSPPTPLPPLDTERFTTPLDDNGFIQMQGTAVPGSWVWNTFLALSYEYKPVAALDASTHGSVPIVEDRLVADTGLQLGITDRLAFAIAGSVALWQTGTALPGNLALSNVAAGNLRVVGRVRILGESADVRHERREGPGLALQATVWIPGIDQDGLFAERAVRAELDALADFHVLGLGIGVMLGARYRPVVREWLDARFTSSFLAGVAIEVPIPIVRGFSAIAEWKLETDTTYVFRLAQTISELDVGPRMRLGDLTLTAAVGFGLVPGVGSPVVRGQLTAVFTPRVHDQDGDGIPDERDQCPPLAEDHDGFEDADGCPDPDNDNDLVPDPDDHCPNVAAEEGHDEDEDGCTDADADHDGVPDPRDQCRDQPEDHDGFQDDDGCPDPDNDGDGIPDERDQCPNEPETMEGVFDEDGCPDTRSDHDGDGVPDASDRCPNEPEDRDGHADDDGCPDPDDDHDGVLDANDHCPDQPETVNGVADDDGCPDTGGHALWRVAQSSVISGQLHFDARGALPASENAALDQLAILLRASGDRDVRLAPAPNADARIAALRAALLSRGVPEASLQLSAHPGLRGNAVEAWPIVYQH